MLLQYALLLFQCGIIVLRLNVEASESFGYEYNMYKLLSSHKTTIKKVCVTIETAYLLPCASMCTQTPSCQMFIHSKQAETCTGFATLDQGILQDGSKTNVSVVNFKKTMTYVYKFDPVSKVTFHVYEIRLKWTDAQRVCVADGARLISFDQKEKLQVSRLLGNGLHWIGVTDMAIEGQWTWTSGTALNRAEWNDYLNNYDNSVSGSGRYNADCAPWRPSQKHTFYDVNCDKLYIFICEKV